MTKKDDQTPNAPDETEKQGGGVAVAEKPREVTFEDEDLVTVLHGWTRVRPGEKHYVDKILFEGGVARNVPYRIARHWQKGTRPDGKSEQIYGRVVIQAILPNQVETGEKDKDGKPVFREVSDADFAKATGITPRPMSEFAAMLAGVDLDEVVKHLGVEKVKALIAGLNERVPAQPPK